MTQDTEVIQAHLPLSIVSEDEQILGNSVRRFARKEIAPLSHSMDEAQKMDPALIKKLFDQGLMGIEVPVNYGAEAQISLAPSLPFRRYLPSIRRSARW